MGANDSSAQNAQGGFRPKKPSNWGGSIWSTLLGIAIAIVLLFGVFYSISGYLQYFDVDLQMEITNPTPDTIIELE